MKMDGVADHENEDIPKRLVLLVHDAMVLPPAPITYTKTCGPENCCPDAHARSDHRGIDESMLSHEVLALMFAMQTSLAEGWRRGTL